MTTDNQPTKKELFDVFIAVEKAITPLIEKYSKENVQIAAMQKLKNPVYQSAAFKTIFSMYDLCKPAYDVKSLSLSGALHYANDETIHDMMNFMFCLTSLLNSLERVELNDDIQSKINSCKTYLKQTESDVHSELFERISWYRSDIEELLETKGACR